MILVSACLLGHNCKYNGGNNLNEDVVKFIDGRSYAAICPETAGGLKSPRQPAEQVVQESGDIKIIDRDGKDLTREFLVGASKTLLDAMEYAFRNGETIEGAILKANSPSCGVGMVYDGTFTGAKVEGDGVMTGKLKEMGIPVATEYNFEEILK